MLLVAATVGLLGCGAPPTLPPPTPIRVDLPTREANADCAGEDFSDLDLLILQGGLGVREPVWAVGSNSGTRYSLEWPAGHYALFTPSLEIRAGGGRVVARQGDALDAGGTFLGDAFSICSFEVVRPPR
jgi:hypothetical protein